MATSFASAACIGSRLEGRAGLTALAGLPAENSGTLLNRLPLKTHYVTKSPERRPECCRTVDLGPKINSS